VELLGDAVIGDLGEGSDGIEEPAADEKRCLIDGGIVVGPESGCGSSGLIHRCIRQRCLQHGREWNVALAVIPDIAVHLEFAAIFRELRAERSNVAGRAGLSGLASEAGHRIRRPHELQRRQD
jgi:hypothetical protein